MADIARYSKDKRVRITATHLKEKFLHEAAPLLDQYIKAALGEDDLKFKSSTARDEVWDLMKQLILKSSDKMDIEIKNVEDILTAVASGVCTLQEGEKLLSLYEKAKAIETGGRLINPDQAPKVYILGQGAAPLEVDTKTIPGVKFADYDEAEEAKE